MVNTSKVIWSNKVQKALSHTPDFIYIEQASGAIEIVEVIEVTKHEY